MFKYIITILEIIITRIKYNIESKINLFLMIIITVLQTF